VEDIDRLTELRGVHGPVGVRAAEPVDRRPVPGVADGVMAVSY
jgi:hypothetical protein